MFYEKIVIAEDDELIGGVLKKLLKERFGSDVFWARSGNEVLALIEKESPFLVFLDYMMPPGPNGLEVLQQIRKNETCSNLAVVVMSNEIDVEPELVKQFEELGVISLISKGLDLVEIYEKIEAVFYQLKAQ